MPVPVRGKKAVEVTQGRNVGAAADQQYTLTRKAMTADTGNDDKTAPRAGKDRCRPASSLIPPLRPVRSISLPLQDLAVSRLFFDYVVEPHPEHRQLGDLSFLPGMVRTIDADSCLAHAVCAAALANFSRRERSPDARTMGGARYRRALRALADALQDTAKLKSDQLLVTIHMLAMYEVRQTVRQTCITEQRLNKCRVTRIPMRRATHGMLTAVGRSSFCSSADGANSTLLTAWSWPSDRYISWYASQSHQSTYSISDSNCYARLALPMSRYPPASILLVGGASQLLPTHAACCDRAPAPLLSKYRHVRSPLRDNRQLPPPGLPDYLVEDSRSTHLRGYQARW